MKALDKTKNELIEEHDRLCDVHDELLEKYKTNIKNNSFIEKNIDKLKIAIELKKIEARISILSDAIESVDAKMTLFKEMPKAGVDTTNNSKNTVSSKSIKNSLDSMKSVIEKEYNKLDILVYKKVLSHYFIDERRKGIKKYEVGYTSLLGGALGMAAAIIFSTAYQSMLMPFIFVLLGASIANVIKTIKINNNIKVFKKLNDELTEEKLELTSDNGIQEVYDLSSQINKKSHDIMIMETIYKEQMRNYEDALLNESNNNSDRKLNAESSFINTRNMGQYDENGNIICNSGRWAGYVDIPSDYPSKMLVECSSRTERDDTMEMGELYRHLEDDEIKLSLRR